MQLRKHMVVGALVATGASALIGVQAVNAASNTSPENGLVSKIASTFNLSKDDVQKAFDQQHQERKTARMQKFQDRVNAAVKEGKLSQNIGDQLVAKVKDLVTYRDSLKDKTLKERRDAMKTKVDELVKWAKENNVPRELYHSGMGREMEEPRSEHASSTSSDTASTN
jgi:hypothetical protein